MPLPPRSPRWRSPEHVQLLVLDRTPLFFCMRDGPWFPTLRLLHQVGAELLPGTAAAAGVVCMQPPALHAAKP